MKTFVSQYSQRSRSLWATLMVIVAPRFIVGVALTLVAWGGSATPAAASSKAPTLGLSRGHVVHTVNIIEMNGSFFFQPASLTIKVGDVVVWRNASAAPHTVTSNTGVFNNPSILMTNQTFRFTFTQAGTFRYHCNIHLYMQATIVVMR